MIKLDNIMLKKPGTGLKWEERRKILGKVLVKKINLKIIYLKFQMSKKNRKICVVINNRANYARIKYFLKAAQKISKIELSIILGASANLERYGELSQTLKKDGFNPKYKISTIVEGENPISMAKSTGLSIIELSSIFEKIKPDIVLTVADRFEKH